MNVWSAIALSLFSGVLLSVPFLLPGAGFVALVALLPLLALERALSAAGKKGFFLYAWLGFSAWNFITTFWVCNATLGGGIFTGFANAFKMALLFQLFHWSRKRLSGVLPYLFLASMWIAWEKIYYVSPIPWPWLVFGNAFAGSIHLVQWYEWTGVLGGSLWVWASNLGLFGLMTAFAEGNWPRWNRKSRIASVCAVFLTLTVPMAVSAVLWSRYEESQEPLDVLITQPDFDPYMKFELYTQTQQNEVLEAMIRENLPAREPLDEERVEAPLLILAPETFTSSLWLPGPAENETVTRFATLLEDYPYATLLMGASAYTRIERISRPSATARPLRPGLWYESHNSALSFNADAARLDLYHKSRLVPATESTPFPSLLGRFDDEVLGGVMARCIGQKEASLLYCYGDPDIPVAPIICYESIFGDYCREFVLRGARALCVITNDAWWGNTPGYRQHLDFARLRAVEMRRDVARSANTGISAIINQRGEIVSRTSWWQREVLRGQIQLNDARTFFVRHGDITGRICTFLFLLLLALWCVRLVVRKPLK